MGDLDGTNLTHALFTFLLLFQKLALTGDVAAVALGGHVLTDLADGFTGNDFGAYCCLDGDVELLAGCWNCSLDSSVRPRSRKKSPRL